MNANMQKTQSSELVSVVVPVFNAAKYLKPCLDSVLNQHYEKFELLLIDDGSTDNSPEICDEYARRDSRIRIFHTVNSGVSASRNIGLEHAKGELIFFLDADDFLESDAFSKLIEAGKRTQAEWVIGNALIISSQGQSAGIRLTEDKLLDMQDMAYCVRDCLRYPQQRTALFTSWGKLFMASIIRENQLSFDTEFSCYEDADFNFRYMTHIHSIAYLKNPLYNHLVKDSSLSVNTSGHPRSIFGYFKSLSLIREFLKDKIGRQELSQLIGHACVTCTIIKMVHICRRFNRTTAKDIYATVKEVINNPLLRDGLPFYSPGTNGSQILPVLIKFKLIWPIVAICRYKAYKRFGKEK